MHYYRAVLILGLGIIAGAVGCYALLDPTLRLGAEQKAIIDEYLLVYCQHSKPGLPDDTKIFVIGEAATMSRVTIAAGLGPLALVEYAKCKTTEVLDAR